MRRRFASVVFAALVVSITGCLSGFKHPLGDVSQSFVDKHLLGAWVCGAADESEPVDLTFVNFDDRQYLLHSNDHKSDVYSHRVIATQLESGTFLSLRPIAPKAEDEWTLLQYYFADSNHLSLKLVDPDSFEDVLDDPQAVRDRLSAHVQDSEVVEEFLSCTRSDARSE